MPAFHRTQLERFLQGNQQAIAGLLEQAYTAAGGHYAALTDERRRQQAVTDSQEFIADLLRGGVDRAAVYQAAYAAAGAGIAVEDIIRMATALESLFAAFVQEHLAAQPLLQSDLQRRGRNVFAAFRANLATARLDDALRRFSPR